MTTPEPGCSCAAWVTGGPHLRSCALAVEQPEPAKPTVEHLSIDGWGVGFLASGPESGLFALGDAGKVVTWQG